MKNKSILYIAFFILVIIFLSNKLEAQIVGTTVSITGSVYSQTTHEPITVFLVVMDESGKRVSATRSNASDNGYYYIAGLKPGQKYTISIAQKGYFKEKIDFEIPNSEKYEEISKDFQLKPLDAGTQIKINVPPFELNKSKLRFGAEQIIDGFVASLQNNPEVKIQVLCYPDNGENKQENKTLTEERSKSIQDYLVKHGIDASRVTIKGSATTDTNDPPPVNRRAKGKRYIGPTYIVVL
jgi:outer membrane protein OmpA-like peptidoglycan-associated protein